MDDSDRSNRGSRVKQALHAEEEITGLEWPSISPEMNPIGKLWDFVCKAIHNRRVPIKFANDLAAVEGRSRG